MYIELAEEQKNAICDLGNAMIDRVVLPYTIFYILNRKRE